MFCNMIFSWVGPSIKLEHMSRTSIFPLRNLHIVLSAVLYQTLNGENVTICLSINLITEKIKYTTYFTNYSNQQRQMFFNVTRVYFNWKFEFSSTRLMCSVVIISFFNGNNLNNHKQVKKKKKKD